MSQPTEAEIADASFKPHVKEAADKLLELINRHVAAQVAIASVKREPLSELYIYELWSACNRVNQFARAIEQAHGITATTASREDGDG